MRVSSISLNRCSTVIETYLRCTTALNSYYEALYYARNEGNPTLAGEIVRLLCRYQMDRSLAAYSLIVNGLVWDAEIIIRTVYETTIKILLLGASNEKKRNDLANEYVGDLSSIYDRKGADKADQAIRLVKDFDRNDVRIFEALRDPQSFNTVPTGNKRYRNELEQRWSFSGIVKALSSSSVDHERVVGLDALNHMYGIMSHLAHASPKALDLMADRATRDADLYVLESTHICRMLSDLVSLWCFSLNFAHKVERGLPSSDDILSRATSEMHEAGLKIREEFDRSQDELYEKKNI